MAGPRNPAIESLPAWSGSTFTSTLNNAVPDYLLPSKQSLPSPFVAVVTGASRGIGRATAKSFAEAGATGLILTARSANSIEETKKECLAIARSRDLRVVLLSADNALESSAEQVAKTVENDFKGHLDLLINNAGILSTNASAFGKVADVDPSEIEVTMNVNYLGRFYMIKHLMPFLQSTSSGAQAIINVSSIGSQVSGPLGYSISALATNRLSQRIAESHGEEGVMCYAVHPGAVMPEGKLPPGCPPRLVEMSLTDIKLAGAWFIWLVKEKREWLNGRYLDVTWDPNDLEKKRDEIVQGDKLKMRLVV